MKNQYPSEKRRKEQQEAIQKQRKKLDLSKKISKKDIDLKAIEKYILNERPTNFDIMMKFNISYSTFYDWLGRSKKEWKEFKEVIFGSRETLKEQTINKLESNLLKRAEGMVITETITELIVNGSGEDDDINNRVVKRYVKEIKKELPPDVKAIETYLKHNSDRYKPDKLVDNNIIIGNNKTNIDDDKQVIINIKTTEDSDNGIECGNNEAVQ